MLTLFGVVACATKSHVTRTQDLADTADVPYRKILVIALFDSFDARRYLEEETVKRLAELGTESVPSTSMMNTRTPLIPETFIDMVEKIDADGVVVTQLASHVVEATERDARPEATVNFWPTYYWNVWEVQTTEYVEPPRITTEHQLVLKTEAFSVASREPVWAIHSISEFSEVQEDGLDYSIFVREAHAIADSMARDGVVDN